MMKVSLIRKETSDQGTFGSIHLPQLSLFSGELPWRNNQPNVSCIPAGTYQCFYTFSLRFKRRMYLVDGVPNRAGIRLHSANLMGDVSMGYKAQVNGCLSFGKKLGIIEGQKAILISATACRELEQFFNYEPFMLDIVDDFSSV